MPSTTRQAASKLPPRVSGVGMTMQRMPGGGGGFEAAFGVFDGDARPGIGAAALYRQQIRIGMRFDPGKIGGRQDEVEILQQVAAS